MQDLSEERRFALGRVLATPGAVDFMVSEGVDWRALLRRHVGGDWGDVGEFDAGQNEVALVRGERVLSAYEHPGGRVWIITEADRSATTLLLPDEY